MAADAAGFWMQNAGRFPLLTPAQEITYGNQIRQWLDSDNPDRKTIRRGQRAKQRFIESNLKLVITIAKKYTKRIASASSLSLEDLLQEGCIGLNRAAEKFNPAAGYKFSTYCYWWISQAVGRVVQVQRTTIKLPNHAQEVARKWRYRPEDQTLEEFAEAVGRTPSWVSEVLARFDAAQPKSLDTRLTLSDGDGMTLLDFQAYHDPSVDETDFVDAIEHLREVDDACLKDALAALELSQDLRPLEVAELLGCSVYASKQKLNDMKALVREHTPTYIREQIVGNGKTEHARMPLTIPAVDVSPVRELITATACSTAAPLAMTQSIQPTANGCATSLEAEAMEVIASVQSEPTEVQAAAPRRKRRTKAEVVTDSPISVTVDGTQFDGQADHIARLINAMKQVA